MSKTMFYVACWPDHPDEAFAACVDDPGYKKDTARSIADWIARGGDVQRVTAEEGRAMMERYCKRHGL